jgi:hypothetical protein
MALTTQYTPVEREKAIRHAVFLLMCLFPVAPDTSGVRSR